MPNEDYNANFEALLLHNLKKIHGSTSQKMSKSEFVGLDDLPYMHTDELIRDIEELYFIETEYDDDIYFLTEQGYTYLEQQGVEASSDDALSTEEAKKPRSRILDVVLIGAGLLALLYAAGLFLDLKEKNSEINRPNQEINSK